MKEESKMERLLLTSKPKVVVTQRLQNQINYLHSKINNLEWSGELITTEEGTINDLGGWIIRAHDIFLCDIGTSGYTEYEVGKGAYMPEDVISMYDKYPGLSEGTHKAQHIHSHHNMSAFFSGTDHENLEDRAKAGNYTLMLIVNHSGNYVAKVAFVAKVEGRGGGTLTLANNVDNFRPIALGSSAEKEVLVVMECEIEYEEPVIPEGFEDRYKRVEAENKAKVKAPSAFPTKQLGLGFHNHNWREDYEHKNGVWRPKEGERQGLWIRADFHNLVDAIVKKENKGEYAIAPVRLERLSKKLKTTIDKENFLSAFEADMRDTFDKLFPGKDDSDYTNLLALGLEILEGHLDNKLTEEVFNILWNEVDVPYKAASYTQPNFNDHIGGWD